MRSTALRHNEHERRHSDPASSTGRSAALAPDAAATRDGERQKARLADLSQQVQRILIRHRGETQRFSSGFPALDALLGGGLTHGSVYELVSRSPWTAARSLALALAVRAAGAQRQVAVFDSSGDFYPPAAAQFGIALEQLLIVRHARAADALWAIEQMLRCRAIGGLIADVCVTDSRVSRRLQLAAEIGAGVCLLLRRARGRGQLPGRESARRRSDEIHVAASTAGETGARFVAGRLFLEPLAAASQNAGVAGALLSVGLRAAEAGADHFPVRINLSPMIGRGSGIEHSSE